MRQLAVALLGGLAVVALAFYVTFAETGPIGWLNAGQMWVAGSYSPKLSVLALIVVVGIPAILAWNALFPNGARGRSAEVAPVASRPPSRTALLAMTWLVLVSIIWIGAVGYRYWQQRQSDRDVAAEYAPIELAAGMTNAVGDHDHLALRGRVLGERTVAQRGDGDSSAHTLLVPIVERTWRPGDPVHFVVKVEGASTLPAALQVDGAPILVRSAGGVPVPALQVFERMKTPIAADALALVLVPSQDGRAVATTPGFSWEGIVIWCSVGSLLVTLLLAMAAIVPALSERAERKRQARRAAELSRR